MITSNSEMNTRGHFAASLEEEEVSYEQYSAVYQSEGYCFRKIVAIPYTVLFGVIYPALDLIGALFSLIQGDREAKTRRFHQMSLKLEVAFGWLMTLFNDRWGTYIITGAQFVPAQEKTPIETILQIGEEENLPQEDSVGCVSTVKFHKNDPKRESIASSQANTTFEESVSSGDESDVQVSDSPYKENSSFMDSLNLTDSFNSYVAEKQQIPHLCLKKPCDNSWEGKSLTDFSSLDESSFIEPLKIGEEEGLRIKEVSNFLENQWVRCVAFIPEAKKDHWLRSFQDFSCAGTWEEFTNFAETVSSEEKDWIERICWDFYPAQASFLAAWNRVSGLMEHPTYGEKFHCLLNVSTREDILRVKSAWKESEKIEILGCLQKALCLGKEIQRFCERANQDIYRSQREAWKGSLSSLSEHVNRWVPQYELTVNSLTAE